LLSIPWQKPHSKKSRQILVLHGVPKKEVRPTRIERRARLVSAIARGRRWLDEIVSGSVIGVEQIAVRQKMQYASGQYDDFARVPRTRAETEFFLPPRIPDFQAAERSLPLEIQLPGTEFLDAETGGQKSALETADVRRDGKSGDDTGEIPAETAFFGVADEMRSLGRLDGGVRS